MTRRFEFTDAKSNKFWEITIKAKTVTVQYGRIGTDGQTQFKEYATPAEAKTAAEKQMAEKVKKGYREVVGEGASTTESASEGQWPLEPLIERLAAQLGVTEDAIRAEEQRAQDQLIDDVAAILRGAFGQAPSDTVERRKHIFGDAPSDLPVSDAALTMAVGLFRRVLARKHGSRSGVFTNLLDAINNGDAIRIGEEVEASSLSVSPRGTIVSSVHGDLFGGDEVGLTSSRTFRALLARFEIALSHR